MSEIVCPGNKSKPTEKTPFQTTVLFPCFERSKLVNINGDPEYMGNKDDRQLKNGRDWRDSDSWTRSRKKKGARARSGIDGPVSVQIRSKSKVQQPLARKSTEW